MNINFGFGSVEAVNLTVF